MIKLTKKILKNCSIQSFVIDLFPNRIFPIDWIVQSIDSIELNDEDQNRLSLFYRFDRCSSFIFVSLPVRVGNKFCNTCKKVTFYAHFCKLFAFYAKFYCFSVYRDPISSLSSKFQMALDKIELRVLIRYCWKLQLSTRDAAKEICDAEGEGTVHYTTVSRWYKRFDSGDPKPRRSTTCRTTTNVGQ